MRDFGIVLILLLINLFCFQRTLKGYFLADDFVHVPYLVEVFNGHADLLWRNFYSNWLQAQGTEFYRPFISITLAIDYALWKTNAAGYHLTNFLYQVASSCLLFLCARRMFDYRSSKEANCVGFLAGAFFAAYPLHPEVVSWIIARVDSVATTFLLLSFWLYLRASDSKSVVERYASCLAFVIALLSKEMAITLPPALVLLELLRANNGTVPQRIKQAGKNTWPYWALLLVYLGVRTASLGTVSGGYAGSIGHGLSSSLFKRWFQDGSFLRVIFPLNAELPGSVHRLVRTLKLLYEIALALVAVRIVILLACDRLKQWAGWLFFALGWFVIALAPTYQVWNLTETLQGSRFIYMGTAPLCFFLALLISPMQYTPSHKSWQSVANGSLALLSVAILFCFMQMTYQNNGAWAQASRGVRAFREGIEEAFKNLSTDKALVVLNIPQRYQGAHMLYNAATLSVLLRPPLSPADYNSRVFTFEPITFGDADLINSARLRNMLTTAPTSPNQPSAGAPASLPASTHRYEFVKWDAQAQKFMPLHLVPARETRSIQGWNMTDNPEEPGMTWLVAPVIDVPSTATDFVDLTLVLDQKPVAGSVAMMSWNTQSDPIFRKERTLVVPFNDANPTKLRFNVSEHKSWTLSETIHQLKFQLPAHVTISKLNLTTGDGEIPQLEADAVRKNDSGRTMAPDVAGICRPGNVLGYFSYDASKVAGADHVVIEVSKPDSWFEHYSGTLRDKRLSQEISLADVSKDLQRTGCAIAAKRLGRPGFYQLRVSAVDKKGNLVGYPSDPLNLQFSSADVK